MPTYTARLRLPLPTTADLVSTLRDAITATAVTLDNCSLYGQGTIAAIPTAGKSGRRYYATDLGTDFFDTGSSWVPVGTPTPIGTISHHSQAGDPSDPGGVTRWMACDGRAISRSTYALLFAAIGTTYGIGNGSTTFNIPDGRARVLVGAGPQTGLATRTIGQTGGPVGSGTTYLAEETHVVAQGELPSHSHGGTTGVDSPDHGHFLYSDPGHFHGINTAGNQASFDFGGTPIIPGIGHQTSDFVGTGISIGGAAATFPGSGTRHQHSTGAGGTASTSHNNLQPFIAVNRIIKVL